MITLTRHNAALQLRVLVSVKIRQYSHSLNELDRQCMYNANWGFSKFCERVQWKQTGLNGCVLATTWSVSQHRIKMYECCYAESVQSRYLTPVCRFNSICLTFFALVWRFLLSRLVYVPINFTHYPLALSSLYNRQIQILNIIQRAAICLVQEVQKCLYFRINTASPSDWSKWGKGGGKHSIFFRFKWECPELPINNFLPAAHTVSCHAFLQTPKYSLARFTTDGHNT
jgi:hypothetical protein